MICQSRCHFRHFVGNSRPAVAGHIIVRVLASDRTAESEYAFDIAVDDTGLITRYHMLEDSWAVSEAARS